MLKSKIGRELNDFAEIIFNNYFVFGFFHGIIFACLVLMKFRGLYFTFTGREIYAFHVIYLCYIFQYFYLKIKSPKPTARFLSSLLFTLMLWFIHDSYACLSVFTQGLIRFGYTVDYQSVYQIAALYSRNLLIIGISIFCLNHAKRISFRNLKTLSLMACQLAIWVYIAYYKGPMFMFDPLTLLFDFIPYIWVVRE